MTAGLPGPAPVQRKVALGGERPDAAALDAAAAAGVATSSGPLPELAQVQAGFGHHRVDHVRAHQGPEAAASAASIGAEAFAVGDHVVLGAVPTLHTIAHEAAHVVQQRGGVARKGGDDDWLERHADAVADRIVAGHSAEALLDEVAGAGGASDGGPRRKVSIDGVVLRDATQVARYPRLPPTQRTRLERWLADEQVHAFRDAVALYEALADDWQLDDTQPGPSGADAKAVPPDDKSEVDGERPRPELTLAYGLPGDDSRDRKDEPSAVHLAAATDPGAAGLGLGVQAPVASASASSSAAVATTMAATTMVTLPAAADAKDARDAKDGGGTPAAGKAPSAADARKAHTPLLDTSGADLLRQLGRGGRQPGLVQGLLDALDAHRAAPTLATVSEVLVTGDRLCELVSILDEGAEPARTQARIRVLSRVRAVLDRAHAERARLLRLAVQAAEAGPSQPAADSKRDVASADSKSDSKAAVAAPAPRDPITAAVGQLPESQRKPMASVLRLARREGFHGSYLRSVAADAGPAIVQNWRARGDMYHVAAVLRLYPQLKLIIFDLDLGASIGSAADDAVVREHAARWDQACLMSEYYGLRDRVFFTDAGGVAQRASSGTAYDLHSALREGAGPDAKDTPPPGLSSMFVEVGGCTTLVGLALGEARSRGPDALGRARGILADSVAPDHKDPDRLSREEIVSFLEGKGWQRGRRYVIVNFRESGHAAIHKRLREASPSARAQVARDWDPSGPQAGGNHPELDTGVVGVEQLGALVRDHGFEPVFMGEAPADAKQPHLIRYWDFQVPHGASRALRAVKAGGRADEAYFMRVVADTFDVRLLAMRSGVTDQLAFLGIPTISIDIDNFHRNPVPELYARPGYLLGQDQTAHSWARGTKLEAGLERDYGRVFLQQQRPLRDFDEKGQWRGAFGRGDQAAIGDAIDFYFGDDSGGARGLRHWTHPFHPEQLDSKHARPGMLADGLRSKIDTGLNPDAVLGDLRLLLAHREPDVAAAKASLRSHVGHTLQAALSSLDEASPSDRAAGRPAAEAKADAAHHAAERCELDADQAERDRLGFVLELEAAGGGGFGSAADDDADDGGPADDSKAADSKAADSKAADSEAADSEAADSKAADDKAAVPAMAPAATGGSAGPAGGRQVNRIRQSLRRADARAATLHAEAHRLRVQAGELDRAAAVERVELGRRLDAVRDFLRRAETMIRGLGAVAPPPLAADEKDAPPARSAAVAASTTAMATTSASLAREHGLVADDKDGASPTVSTFVSPSSAVSASAAQAPGPDEKGPAPSSGYGATALRLSAETVLELCAEIARLGASLPR